MASERQANAFVLDHMIVFDQDPEAAVQPFVDAGYPLRPPRVHKGQGTRNQSVQLTPSIFLEFLCVHDAIEARSNPLRLDRYRSSAQACPFGIAWRGTAPPPRTWQYHPPYPSSFELWICDHVRDDVTRPLEFVLVDPTPAQAAPVVDVRLTLPQPHTSLAATLATGAARVNLSWPEALAVDDGLVFIAPAQCAQSCG